MKTSDSSRSANRTGSTRREFLAGTSLAALGVTSVLTGGVASLAPATASAAPSEGPPEELQDFTYDLEIGTKGWTGPGGSAKEATVAEFPLSQSIAGVSMRLDVGGFRELHWHAIAAQHTPYPTQNCNIAPLPEPETRNSELRTAPPTKAHLLLPRQPSHNPGSSVQ